MNTEKKIEIDPIDVEGLDDVFENDSRHIEDSQYPDSNLDTGLNIKEAAKYYDLSVASIRLKIKLGEIPAIKIAGKTGPEWAVFPNGVPDYYQKDDSTVDGVYHQVDNSPLVGSDEPINTMVEGSYRSDSTSLEALKHATNSLNKSLEMQRELMHKLEVLTYKNGYLESQVQEREREVKLLPDLQAQAERARELEEERASEAEKAEKLAIKVEQLQTELELARIKEEQLSSLQKELTAIKDKQEAEKESKKGLLAWFFGTGQ